MSVRISHSLVRALRDVPIFADAEEELLLDIVGVSANLLWHPGETVFEVDDDAEALYVVLCGRVEIAASDDGGETRIAEVTDGGYFGEQALLADARHSKTVRALEETELMVIPEEAFRSLLDDEPGLAEVVRDRLEQRLERRGS